MTMTRTVTLALALCVAGCSGKKDGGPEAKPPGEGPQKAPVSAAPVPNPKAIEIEAFRLGRALAPDGSAVDEGAPFGQGEPIHVSFQVRNAPAGSAVKIIVTSLPDKRKVHEDQKAPSGGKNDVAFTLPPTRTWAQGEYHIEMQVLDGPATRGLGGSDFKLGPPKPEKK